jgi:hypothetical protein
MLLCGTAIRPAFSWSKSCMAHGWVYETMPYGIEMYAAIDGYSRYVLWIPIGISTRTHSMCISNISKQSQLWIFAANYSHWSWWRDNLSSRRSLGTRACSRTQDSSCWLLFAWQEYWEYSYWGLVGPAFAIEYLNWCVYSRSLDYYGRTLILCYVMLELLPDYSRRASFSITGLPDQIALLVAFMPTIRLSAD